MDLVRITTSFVLLVLSLTLAVCASSASFDVPDGAPTVRGTLADVRHSATGSGLTIEAGGGGCGMVATADARTRVLRRSARGGLTVVGIGAAGVGALDAGDRVAVWADGPVMESCPLQGRAAVVVVEAAAVAEAALVGRWVHAVEEDAGGVEVYRRGEAEAFPPRMFRQRYAFQAGGHADVLVPHPADAHDDVEGRWSLASGVVTVRYQDRVTRLRVVEVTPDALRVVREG